jgi:antitoxin (DNA-binding transcriptional repressor) of toxin-antitoxin stability system
VEITKHGRVVAVLLSPRELAATQMPSLSASEQVAADKIWGRTHMIPPELARLAIVTKPSIGFDDD